MSRVEMGVASRRALLASALAVPAIEASAQDVLLDFLRVSIAVDRFDAFLPLLQAFAAAAPDLTVEILVRDDNAGLLTPRNAEQISRGHRGVNVVLADVFDLAWGSMRGAWRPLPERFHMASMASAGALADLMSPLASEEGLLVSASPGGPILLHRRSILPDPPRDLAALLDYARQNPGHFFYPRPSESVFGRLFLMILPHLLGDRDPSDVQTGWDRSWAWLEELARYVSFYPSSDEAAFEELAAGDVHLCPAPLAAFLRGRMDGDLAEDTGFVTLGDGAIIPQGLFLAVPRFTAPAKLPVIERFARFLLLPDVQTRFFGRGLLPGDLGFGLSEGAPRNDAERSALRGILPPEDAQRIVAASRFPRLSAPQLTFLLNAWEERIGSRHGERQ